MDLSSITPTPAALRALSHPVRLRMLALLRTEGPATATTLAARLGLNTGATSYHLRQLAEHGFVVDDPERGDGRDRWWQAAHRATVTNSGRGVHAGGAGHARRLPPGRGDLEHRAAPARGGGASHASCSHGRTRARSATGSCTSPPTAPAS